MAFRNLFAGTVLAALTACAGGDVNGGSAASGDQYIRAHSTQQLMALVVQPAAQEYWDSVQYISDADGNHDIFPKTDEEWAATQAAGATVSELGNLLMTPLYAEGRGEDWIEFSRALVQIGQRAEEAAVNRDTDAIFEVGGTMYNVCSACHQAYPAEQPAEGEQGA